MASKLIKIFIVCMLLKNRLFWKTCVYLLLLAGVLEVSAQTRTIRGKVTNGIEPLIGAFVDIKDQKDGAVTDIDGAFELKSDVGFPWTLKISYIGYVPKEITVTESQKYINVTLEEEQVVLTDVVIKGQRVSEKQKANPLSVETVDVLAIKEAPALSFYEALGNMKGVDITSASLGFKIINTRGFNSTSPVRSLQTIDGVDNQSPGLNFSLGNFLGSSELDVLKVDIIAGASSAYYGPNAFNGVVSMETKSPFFFKGLTASLKAGERNLFEGAFRWADAIKNKKGQEFFGYKINFFHLRAYDWVADNYDPVYNTPDGKQNPGGFDAVNIYGDETNTLFKSNESSLSAYIGMGSYHRAGYKEEDIVDYNTRNTKANVAFHLRTAPAKAEQSPELVLSSSFGAGTTVYQGDNRFSLRNILFFQNRLEFRKADKFFIRAYATNENAGDSYDPYFTALILQKNAKTDQQWNNRYIYYWQSQVDTKINAMDYPQPQLMFTPEGIPFFVLDTMAARNWQATHQDFFKDQHQNARNYADSVYGGFFGDAFFQPGTQRFKEQFDKITQAKSSNKGEGTRFFDKSALYHLHGQYKFTPTWADITVGANGRYYAPNSEGTIFYDSIEKITNYEFGVYGGIEKKWLNNRLTTSATLRLDKNQNFDLLPSPAASIVYKTGDNSFLRFSFSSAIRNPTLSDQFLNLNVGRAILSGNLHGVDSLVTIDSYNEYRGSLNLSKLKYFNIDGIKPEKAKTLEVGYRTTLFNSLYIDAGYYFTLYNDFIGYNIGIDAAFDQATGLPIRTQVYRYSANSTNQVQTQGLSIGANYFFKQYYMVNGNYSWNTLVKTVEEDPIIPAFNTPEHKFNVGLSARDIPLRFAPKVFKTFGFSVNYKWVQGFLFEGSPQFTGFIPSYGLLDAQVNATVPKLRLTLKIGASNLLNNIHYEAYGGPSIGRMAFVSLLYDWKKN